jgi:DNA-directed RNA polymerase specialized sigma24 family protein
VTGVQDNIRWREAAVIAALRDWAQRYGEAPTATDWDRATAYRRGGAAKVARLVEHPTPVPSGTTVIARLGSWSAAIAAAGLPARSATRRLDASQLDATVTLCESGLSTVEVAARLGIAPKTVRDRLAAAGFPLRPRPARRRGADPDREAAVLVAAREGTSVPGIAELFGLSTRAVREVLERHDVAGGPLFRQLRAHVSRLGELELSDREREVVELVVVRRRAWRDVAEQLGISTSTIAKDLRAVVLRLQRVEE